MSANNQLIVRKKKNGLYEVRDCFVDSLIHTIEGIKPTPEELLIEVVADDIKTLEEAVKIANKYMETEVVEYGLDIVV